MQCAPFHTSTQRFGSCKRGRTQRAQNTVRFHCCLAFPACLLVSTILQTLSQCGILKHNQTRAEPTMDHRARQPPSMLTTCVLQGKESNDGRSQRRTAGERAQGVRQSQGKRRASRPPAHPPRQCMGHLHLVHRPAGHLCGNPRRSARHRAAGARRGRLHRRGDHDGARRPTEVRARTAGSPHHRQVPGHPQVGAAARLRHRPARHAHARRRLRVHR